MLTTFDMFVPKVDNVLRFSYDYSNFSFASLRTVKKNC